MSRKNKIIIFGAGGHGKVVLDILLESGADILGFIDDDKNKIGQKIRGFGILGDRTYLKKGSLTKVALGIGNNTVREKIFNKAKNIGVELISAIHPNAVISEDTRIGEGVVIMPGAVINPGVVLENGVVVNTAASIDHDCHLGKFCQIWPGAHLAGNVKLGEFSYVGTGASVIQNIKIGNSVMIGAGAVILKDIPDDVTVAGNPGRMLRR